MTQHAPRAPGQTVGTRAALPTFAVAVLGLTSRAATPPAPSRSPLDSAGPPPTSPDPVTLLGLRI